MGAAPQGSADIDRRPVDGRENRPENRPDHRAVLARLGAEGRRALVLRADAPGLLHLAGHLLALALTGAAIALRLPGWPAVLLPHGILLVFLFCLEHEAVHKTPFRSAWLNRAAAWGGGLVYGLPPVWFHHYHMAHHRFTQDPARDPELSDPVPHTRLGLAWYLTGAPFWIAAAMRLVRNAAGRNADTFVPEKAIAAVAWEARLMLGVYAAAVAVSAALGTTVLLWLWLVPLLLGQPFLRLYLLAEHTGCSQVPDMLRNTRTTYTNPVIRFIAWNMPYHIEHHAYPAVPFHKLPAFNRLIRDDLGVTAKGYTAATRDVVRALLHNGR